jgi:hypothetical protein
MNTRTSQPRRAPAWLPDRQPGPPLGRRRRRPRSRPTARERRPRPPLWLRRRTVLRNPLVRPMWRVARTVPERWGPCRPGRKAYCRPAEHYPTIDI